MSRLVTEKLVTLAQAVRCAPHGSKEAHYQAACAELNLSRATVLRKLKETVMTKPRKQRSDAGETALTLEDAKMISAWLRESVRKNNKRILSMGDAVAQLRAEGVIKAEWVNTATGEVLNLSESSIARALRGYGLHPDQLNKPAPAVQLRSEHPNHVWQIDASLCVLYKMPVKTGNRMEALDSAEIYKNKLGNLIKIEHLLVQRYSITDHASGVIFVIYLLGGESSFNLISAFVAATQMRVGYPYHGIPRMVMLDPGSANTAAPFMNLCTSLGVRVQVNKPKNPRAKGQVEQSHNLIECGFESGLNKLPTPITSVDELNAMALKWMHWMNGTKLHSRHGETRYAAWQRITAEQLIFAPEAEVMFACANEEPESRTVNDFLQVSLKGRLYSVGDMPGVQNQSKVLVCRNAWREDVAQVVMHDAEGRKVMYQAPEVPKGEFGFAEGARMIGEEYRAHKDTPAQIAVKELDKLAMQAATQGEVDAARKKKATPFGGEINPFKQAEEYQAPAWMPKRGAQHELSVLVELPPLTIADLSRQMGRDWQPAFYAVVMQRFPEGKIPAAEADALKARLLRGEQAPLAVVGL
jgi:hypothetical protein